MHDPYLILLVTGLVIQWLFSGVVSSLPEPCETSTEKYKFVYKFCHFLAANMDNLRLPPCKK